MSVLRKFLAIVVDDPVRRRRAGARRHHHRSPRPPELHRRPDPEYHEKGIGDGAAVDLTIVRPAAAAPPSRLEQVVGIAPPRFARA